MTGHKEWKEMVLGVASLTKAKHNFLIQLPPFHFAVCIFVFLIVNIFFLFACIFINFVLVYRVFFDIRYSAGYGIQYPAGYTAFMFIAL